MFVKNFGRKMAVWWLFQVLCIPLAAWAAALWFNPKAHLVGPFLFVSPIIAYGLGFFVLSRMKWWREIQGKMFPEPVSPDAEMDEYAARFARLSGLSKVKLQVLPRELDRPAEIAFGGQKDAVILLHPWNDLDPRTREFAMARAYADLSTRQKSGPISSIFLPACLFAGCLASTFNLWLVLVGQSGTVVGLVLLSGQNKHVREHADRLALEWTRDLPSAIRYVEASTVEAKGPSMPDSRAARIQQLRDHAAELGLSQH